MISSHSDLSFCIGSASLLSESMSDVSLRMIALDVERLRQFDRAMKDSINEMKQLLDRMEKDVKEQSIRLDQLKVSLTI